MITFLVTIEMRMEIGNVSKRQQPNQRVENSSRPPISLQHSEKIPHPQEASAGP